MSYLIQKICLGGAQPFPIPATLRVLMGAMDQAPPGLLIPSSQLLPEAQPGLIVCSR